MYFGKNQQRFGRSGRPHRRDLVFPNLGKGDIRPYKSIDPVAGIERQNGQDPGTPPPVVPQTIEIVTRHHRFGFDNFGDCFSRTFL